MILEDDNVSTPSRTGSAADALRTRFVRANCTTFVGSVFDPRDRDRRFSVEIYLDGFPFAVVRADQVEYPSPLGDGAHGFRIGIPAAILARHTLVSARLANGHIDCGLPIDLSRAVCAGASTIGSGGWLRLAGEGWIQGVLENCGADPAAVFVANGRTVHVARPDHVVPAERRQGRQPLAFGFTAYLADKLEHDRLTWLQIFNDQGAELEGSPLPVVGSPDPLVQDIFRDGVGAKRIDRLAYYRARFPETLPMGLYATWKSAVRPGPSAVAPAHGIILVGSGDPHHSVAGLSIGRGPAALALGLLDTASPVGFNPDDLLRSLDSIDDLPERLVFAPSGTRFADDQGARLVEALDDPSVLFAYGDLELTIGGQSMPYLMPAFDYERLLEQGYCGLVFAAPTAAIQRIVAAVQPRSLYDLVFALLEDLTPAKTGSRTGRIVAHVPFPVAALPALDPDTLSTPHMLAVRDHLHRRGQSARLTMRSSAGLTLPALHVKRSLPLDRSVTVIVPTRDRADLLEPCLSTLRNCAHYLDLDVIVVDNGSQEPATFNLFETLARDGIRILRDERAFNYSRINNDAVAMATAGTVLFLNNDVEFQTEDTLEEMLSRLTEPDVGAVGVLMRRANDVIQHGGVVLGPSFAAFHAHVDRVVGNAGYCDDLRVARQCSAVTAACMMVRRSDFLAVGGFNATDFPVAFNDVDLCLKLAAAGLRTVLTPHSTVIHHESVSRGRDDSLTRRPLFAREVAQLHESWSKVLIDDPFYNPCLGRTQHPYNGLAVNPISLRPRLQRVRLGQSIEV